MITLRDYQENFIGDIRDAVTSGSKAVCCVMPTGGGKTICFAKIIQTATQRGKHSLIIVHRRELIDQTSATLTRHGIEHGIIASGVPTSPSRLCQIAMVQTLARREQPQAEIIILDETHICVSYTYKTLLAKFPDAILLGFSATPSRMDRRGLGEIFTHLVTGPSVSELQAAGFLAKTKYYAPPQVVDLSGVKKQMGEFQISGLESATNKSSVTGDAVDHYRRLIPNMQAIAFCVSVAHAQAVADAFNAAGVASDCIHGGLAKPVRDSIVARLRSGEIRVLTSCEILVAGFDVPAVSACILLRATASLVFHLQSLGRALRPAPDKDFAIILDHVGNLTRLGLAEDERAWTLAGGDEKVAHHISVSTCPKCFATFAPRSSCPECGHCKPTAPIKPIEQVEGELVEFVKVALPAESQQMLIAQSKRTSNLKTLMWIAKQLGYKPGWAWNTAQFNKSRGVPAYG